MFTRAVESFAIFLHPKSPAAVYKNPYPLYTNVLARTLNVCLKFVDLVPSLHRVECNICGWCGWKFGYAAAISTNYFAGNEICLGCNSNKRTRVLLNILAQRLKLTDSEIIVADIGAAKSTRQYFRNYKNIKYITIDNFKDSDVVCDITDIKLPNNSVDFILCCHVIEHVEDHRKALTEILRILKPQHYGIIAVPQNKNIKESRKMTDTNFHGYGHVWEFGTDFPNKLSEAGFQVSDTYNYVESDTNKTFTLPFHIVQKPDSPVSLS